MKDNKIGNLDADQEFQGARDVKRAKLTVLKSDGKANRLSRATALSEDEENCLRKVNWASREYVVQLTGHASVASLNNCTGADIRVQHAMGSSVLARSQFSVSHSSGRVAAPVAINISGGENMTIVHNH